MSPPLQCTRCVVFVEAESLVVPNPTHLGRNVKFACGLIFNPRCSWTDRRFSHQRGLRVSKTSTTKVEPLESLTDRYFVGQTVDQVADVAKVFRC